MISNTSTPIPDDSLLFPQLDNSEIRNIFDQSQFDLNEWKTIFNFKLRFGS